MALVMCVAALATVICQFLRQPLIVGYLVAGMVVGPHVPGVYASTERVQLVSELGVILLVFAIGLEFKFRRLVRLAPTAGLVALIQIVVMIALGYSVGRLLGWTQWDSVLTGAVVSISGIVIVAKAFEEVRVESRVRELVFGIVLCEDVIAILLLAVLVTMANGGSASLRALSAKAGLLPLFVVALIVLGMLTVPYVVRKVASLKRPETLLITSLGLCFAFSMMAERAGYTVALGAFLAGLLVAESGHGKQVEELIKPVEQIFGAIFFVAVGMLIDPHQLATHWRALLVLIAVVLSGKIISVTFSSLLIGERIGVAAKSGFAMAQIGVFSFLLAEVGSKEGSARSLLYTLAVGTSAATAFLCPHLIKASMPLSDWLERHFPGPVQRAASQYEPTRNRSESPAEIAGVQWQDADGGNEG